MSAEPAEPEAAAAVADGMRRHGQGANSIAKRPKSLGALPAGTTAKRAAAAFSMMTSPTSWRQLTQDAGWTFDETEGWLTDSLCRLLIAPTQ